MANTVISPNMNLPVPVVSVDPGPDWANNVNSCLSIIDGHNHSPGSGVQVTPSGININTDLPFNDNNATLLRSVRFTPQSTALTNPSDIGCLYESGIDLYYIDGNGNNIRITQSGTVTGSAGTITGLPSGTASASYVAGTFIFQSATTTPATLNVGSIIIGQEVSSGYNVTLSTNSGQTSNYSLTLPSAAPVANQVLVSDGSGTLTWTRGLIPIGSVLPTFAGLTGAYVTTATIVADANGYVLCNGQTISDSTSPMNGVVVPNINNSIFLIGSTTANSSGGASTVTLSGSNLPSHNHGAGSFATSLSGTFASTSHIHNMSHIHNWAYIDAAGSTYSNNIADAASVAIGTASGGDTLGIYFEELYSPSLSGFAAMEAAPVATSKQFYTTGALNNNSGSGASAGTGGPTSTASLSGSNAVTGVSTSTGSGTSFSILPNYISAVYIMRIK